MKQELKFHEPLHPQDTEHETFGCRHTNPDICRKHKLQRVCAFVRDDYICKSPPSSWKPQFNNLRSKKESFTSNRLADFCELIIDCEHKTAPVQSTGYPSIRTPNIGRGWLELDDVNRVTQTTYEEWTRRAKPKEGDLILAREAPIGNVAIIPKNLEVCLGQRTVLIRPTREKVNPHFLLYLLLGNEIQGKFQALSGGATVAHLNMEEIRKLELPKIPDRIIQGNYSPCSM